MFTAMPSGIEMMLNSLCPGLMPQIKSLVDSGAIDKIIQYADHIEEQNRLLRLLIDEIRDMREHDDRRDHSAEFTLVGGNDVSKSGTD